MKNKTSLKIILITFVWMVTVFLTGVLADHFFSNTPMTFTGAGLLHGDKGIMGQFVRWDAVHYIRISFHGYLPMFPALKAFFPLYSLILRAGTWYLQTYIRDGFYCYMIIYSVVNTLSLFGALLLVQKLYERDYEPEKNGVPAPLFLLMLPCSFFFLSPYPETLSLFLSVSAFYFAVKGRWVLAGLFAAVASGTRLQGIFLCPALAVEYLSQKKWNWKNIRWDAAWLLLCPLGMVSYFWYLGGPQVFLKAQSTWIVRRVGWNPLRALPNYYENAFLGIRADGNSIGWDERVSYHFSFATLCFSLFLLVWFWKRLRASYRMFLVLCIAVPFFSSSIMALQRYNLVMFPLCFAAVEFFKNKPTRLAVTLFVFGLLTCFFVTLFVNGYFVS